MGVNLTVSWLSPPDLPGCAIGAASSGGGRGCSGGAIGGVVGEIAAQLYLKNWLDDKLSDPATAQISQAALSAEFSSLRAQGIDIARLAGGLAALLTGQSVNIAASTAGNAAQFNATQAIRIRQPVCRANLRACLLAVGALLKSGATVAIEVVEAGAAATIVVVGSVAAVILMMSSSPAGEGSDRVPGAGTNDNSGIAGDPCQVDPSLPQCVQNGINGRNFEREALDAMGLPRNTRNLQSQLLNGTARGVRPDSLQGAVWEVKSGITPVFRRSQIQAQYTYAQANNLRFNLIVSPQTRVSAGVIRMVQNTGGRIFEYNPATRAIIGRVLP